MLSFLDLLFHLYSHLLHTSHKGYIGEENEAQKNGVG